VGRLGVVGTVRFERTTFRV